MHLGERVDDWRIARVSNMDFFRLMLACWLCCKHLVEYWIAHLHCVLLSMWSISESWMMIYKIEALCGAKTRKPPALCTFRSFWRDHGMRIWANDFHSGIRANQHQWHQFHHAPKSLSQPVSPPQNIQDYCSNILHSIGNVCNTTVFRLHDFPQLFRPQNGIWWHKFPTEPEPPGAP